MELSAILALVQAVSTIVPQVVSALPSIERLLSGYGTAEDVASVQAVTDTLNSMAEDAEARAGADTATGDIATGES